MHYLQNQYPRFAMTERETGKRKTKRLKWIERLPGTVRCKAWAYFSRSGKTLEVYVSPKGYINQYGRQKDAVIVKISADWFKKAAR